LVWDLFTKELKEQAQRNKDNMARQQLANLQMKEGQLKTYIKEFEKLAEQTGLAQANPTTTQTFVAGLTMPLQEQTLSQPIYRYRVARARAIQEDQKQHAVAEALLTRRQQRERLITLLQKKQTQEEELQMALPILKKNDL
jgi:ribosomal protein S15P/S13E